jgi:hypothetical protein
MENLPFRGFHPICMLEVECKMCVPGIGCCWLQFVYLGDVCCLPFVSRVAIFTGERCIQRIGFLNNVKEKMRGKLIPSTSADIE